MENKLVCVAEYLSYEEGILLFNALEESQISALVKSCGPPSIPFGEGQFYQLLVPEEDLPLAKEITENFKLQVAESRRRIRCPKCKSEAVFKPQSLPFWQKIYYAGTEVFKCESCGKTFSR